MAESGWRVSGMLQVSSFPLITASGAWKLARHTSHRDLDRRGAIKVLEDLPLRVAEGFLRMQVDCGLTTGRDG